MSAIPRQAVADPAAWHGPHPQGDPRWIHHLRADEIAAVKAALAAAGRTVATPQRADVPLGASPDGFRHDNSADGLDDVTPDRQVPGDRWKAAENESRKPRPPEGVRQLTCGVEVRRPPAADE